MCGIAGILRFDRGDVDPGILRAMARAIRHRGPDAEGFFRAPGIGLAHRRLSIIDVAGGGQPLGNEDGAVQIVFNGEIYNFAELRGPLEERGHRLATRSDTEVIVHLYEERGPDVVLPLRGMFAFGIWDARKETLLLARDRLGEKPLYWGVRGGALYFASELKALLSTGAFPREPDPAAIEAYLALGYVPAPMTAFRGVSKLPPGSLLAASRGRIEVERYWSPGPACAPGASSEDEVISSFATRLDDAVRSMMMSDVPLGAFLSGGLDSSAVVSSMAAAASSEVRTFAVGFDEDAADESSDAEAVAAHFGTRHRLIPVTIDALSVLPELVWHFDEPFADSSAIPCWYVCKAAREHVTVALTGDGGDEVFGGYGRYLPDGADRFAGRVPSPLRAALAGVLGLTPPGFTGREFARATARADPERYARRVGVFTYGELDDVLAGPRTTEPEEIITRHLRGRDVVGERPPLAERQMLVDIQTYLPEDILVKMDRMSMAHGLETRPPLLDPRLVEAALALDLGWKIRGSTQKVLLRRIVERRLPDRTLAKRKHGFSVPMKEWLRGGLAPLAERLLASPRALDRGVVRPSEVRRLLYEHRSSRRDHSTRLYALIMLELWFRTSIDAAPSLDRARAEVEEVGA